MLALVTSTITTSVILDKLLIAVIAIQRHATIARSSAIHHRINCSDLLPCDLATVL
jgi:hypothetical protein